MTEVALAGDITAFGIADVIRMLAWAKKTGVLLVENGSEQGLIFVSDGEVVAAEETSSKRRKLGEVLVGGGHLSQQVAGSLIGDLERDSLYVGDILLRHNVIAPNLLSYFLRLQIVEVAAHLLQWTEGQYTFRSNMTHPREEIAVRLKAENLMTEARHSITELGRLREKVVSLDSLVTPGEDQRPCFAISDLSPVERRVLEMATGRHTIRSIAHYLFLSEVQAGKSVDCLATEGLVTVKTYS